MPFLPINIIRLVDDNFPGWVECELIDAVGNRHLFVEKTPVVTRESLERDGSFPRTGEFACEILSSWRAENGELLTTIDTSRPLGIESQGGVTEFVVLTKHLKLSN